MEVRFLKVPETAASELVGEINLQGVLLKIRFEGIQREKMVILKLLCLMIRKRGQ